LVSIHPQSHEITRFANGHFTKQELGNNTLMHTNNIRSIVCSNFREFTRNAARPMMIQILHLILLMPLIGFAVSLLIPEHEEESHV